MRKEKVTIIGTGPAGLTAAIYAARANLKPLIISGLQPGGQLTTTTEVENFPGFEKGIMGPDLMIEMEAQAKRFGTEFLTTSVTGAKLVAGKNILTTDSEEIQTESLIISTGANPRWLGVPGEQELLGYGVSSCATCDGAFFRDVEIAVIGGGDSACEEATFLTKFASKVYLIHRREELRASKIMQERVFKNKKIEPVWNSSIKEIHGSKKDGVTSVTLIDTNTNEEKELDLKAVFIAIGHVPNSELFLGDLDHDEDKYLITKRDSTATNIPGVYACGDVQDHVYRQAVTAAGTGCMAAIEAERWLEEQG